MANMFAMMSASMTEQDDAYIVDALVKASQTGQSYKDALNSLNGVSGNFCLRKLPGLDSYGAD